ncbi:MAG: type VII secretion protein EssC [Oscillospiraceae bacterium]|nr:type VII secretion protein EssC [Oscillospiraceae bacterium]
MFYAWIFFENRFKDVYLPATSRWSENIAVFHSETGWDRDYFIPIRALDGKCYVSHGEKFHWMDQEPGVDELPVTDGVHYFMSNGKNRIGLTFASCKKSDTAFKKFLLPASGETVLGRGPDCDLQVRADLELVSKRQGVFTVKPDGSCVYTDAGKNGSYLNGLSLVSASTRLRFGDVITLSSGIKFIYLGKLLAVNRMSTFAHISLPLCDPPVSNPEMEERLVPSVQIQFHRAPRFVPKADASDVRIEPPMDKQNQQQNPLWLTIGPSSTMVLPMMMGAAISSSRGGYMGAGLAMVGTASVLAVFWGLLNYRYRKKHAAEIEEARVSKYYLYITQAEKFLQDLSAQERKRLLETRPTVEECAHFPQSSSSYRLWERMPTHEDFMSVRIGLGRVPLPNKIIVDDVKLSVIDDPLRDEPSRLAETYGYMSNAPITVNLREETILGILGDSMATSLAQSILLQLAALHSYHDVRIAVITEESDQSRWAWARWLPHVFSSEDRELRMVVSEDNAVQEVLAYLDGVLIQRRESAEEEKSEGADGGSLPLPHYVVFCTKPDLLDNKPILRHMLTNAWGMTLVLISTSMEMLPKECRIVLDASSNPGSVFTAEGDITKVDFEYPNLALAAGFSHMVAPLRVKDSAESAAIPSMVSFLDIYGVRQIESLDVWRFWNENHAYEGLRSIIGLRAGSQPFVLDISDKSHGPHGLVAGTTGSGKSVMLQTYILSLALNYHPDQVRFILIDYKGGGMAEEFRRLPHVTGIIDNLQTGNTIARALASIQGEIHRREKLFRKVGVSSIDDYIRFFYDDPAEERLPHLIIIVDEFAELKADQPDFMQELISASRVGRSLGIHLILSTQKPSNSVSDEIWANSNFRICLRVQSRSDSMEMLRRPDAAYLRNRGRCYVQIGNDEIFEQVQTSYSGLTYDPEKPSETEIPHLLDNAGRFVSVKRAPSTASEREQTQMDAVLGLIIQTARDHGLPESYHLWMEELSAAVFLRSIPGTALAERTIWAGPNTGEELRAIYALADDVANQRHFPVWIDLLAERNYMVVGMVSTGKTTFMQTVAMAFALRYSPDAVQMYVLSLSSRNLSCLAALPHVGEIIYGEEDEELFRLLRLLEEEDKRRRTLFAEASTDSFQEYNHSCNMNGSKPVPAIIVFVDRFAQLTEMVQSSDEFTQLVNTLVREASGRGIFFIVSAMRANEIPYKIRDCFKGVGLQINDRTDYPEIVGMRMPSDMPDIAALSGRGLVEIDESLYEIQIALAGSSPSDAERAADIAQMCQALSERWQGERPANIPRIPEHPAYTDLVTTPQYQAMLSDPWLFTFGYNVNTGTPEAIHLDRSYSFLISGGWQSGKTNLLQLIARLWHDRDANLCVVADEAWIKLCQRLNVTCYDQASPAWEEYIVWLNEEIKSRNQMRKAAQAVGQEELDKLVRSWTPVVIIVDDIDSFIKKNSDVANRLFAEVSRRAAKFAIYFFASISHSAYAQNRMLEPLASLAKQQRGVALGGKLNECDPWNMQMPFSRKNVSFPLGEGYLICNGAATHIVVPQAEDAEG